MVEQEAVNFEVVSSSLTGGAKFDFKNSPFGEIFYDCFLIIVIEVARPSILANKT